MVLPTVGLVTRSSLAKLDRPGKAELECQTTVVSAQVVVLGQVVESKTKIDALRHFDWDYNLDEHSGWDKIDALCHSGWDYDLAHHSDLGWPY